mmetsp:Transcript_56205/g.130938  ORF Transcript_56205/g.130938 Transcript_56205/m.130938 type:complete len:228 (+) Transcript_56205:678-1361(+)
MLQNLFKVRREVLDTSLPDALPHLSCTQQAITIVIQSCESLTQGPDLSFAQLSSYDLESCLFELVLRLEATKVLDKIGRKGLVVRLGCMIHYPLVSQRLPSGIPLLWLQFQQHANEVLCVLGDVLPIKRVEGVAAAAHLGKDLVVCLATEWRVATQHDVHDDAAAPQVARLIVALAHEHLGRYVVGSSGLCLQRACRLKLARQAKINDFQHVVLDGLLGYEQEVLGL